MQENMVSVQMTEDEELALYCFLGECAGTPFYKGLYTTLYNKFGTYNSPNLFQGNINPVCKSNALELVQEFKKKAKGLLFKDLPVGHSFFMYMDEDNNEVSSVKRTKIAGADIGHNSFFVCDSGKLEFGHMYGSDRVFDCGPAKLKEV